MAHGLSEDGSWLKLAELFANALSAFSRFRISGVNYDKDCTVFTAIQVDWFHVFGLSDTYRRVLEACLFRTVCVVMTATYGGPGGARQHFSRFWGPTRKTIWSETPFNV